MYYNKKSIILTLSTLLILTQITHQDCFCGSRDETPNKFGNNAKNKGKGHKANLNSALRENYEIASIVNYIDIFISKFNRMYLKKEHWPKPLKISGVKNLNFFEENNEFNVILNHTISKNLFLKLQVQVPTTFKTKHHFNIMATLVRTNVPEQKLSLGQKKEITKNGVINYELKRVSLSHFFGNQLAVDVCRFMYATLNKIVVENFSINLMNYVYKNLNKDNKSRAQKLDCIVTPSFKVYLGVNQIQNLVQDTRKLMAQTKTTNTKDLKKKIRDDPRIGETEIPSLKRRMSKLLTPIIMEKNGRELLASDYEGTQEYQMKVKEIYGMSVNAFELQNQSFIEDDEEEIQENGMQKKKKGQMLVLDEDPEEVQMRKKVEQDPDHDLTPEEIIQKVKEEVDIKMKKNSEDLIEGEVEQVEKKIKNIENLEFLVRQAVYENFKNIPKTKESKSEDYMKMLYFELNQKTRNHLIIERDLGIDLDEDELDSDQKEAINEYLSSQFVLLRTTPLVTDRNRHFRRVFGHVSAKLEIDQNPAKGKIFGRSKSMPLSKLPIEIEEPVEQEQIVKIIGEGRTVVLSREDDQESEQILEDGLSQNSNLEITNLDLIPVVEDHYVENIPKTELMFSKNDYNPDRGVFNENNLFKENDQLDAVERQEMIKKIIQVRSYIFEHNIKCDFEVYTDSTMFINIPTLELSNLLKELKIIMDSAIEDQVPVLITNEIIRENVEVMDDDEVNKSEVKNMIIQEDDEEGYTEAEFTIDLPGFTKEQVQKMILMMTQDEAFMDINNTIINSDKQDKLDQVYLMGYDITEYISNDLNF